VLLASVLGLIVALLRTIFLITGLPSEEGESAPVPSIAGHTWLIRKPSKVAVEVITPSH